MTHALAYLLGGLFVLAAVRLDGWPLLLAAIVIWGALGAVLHLAQRQRLAALLQTRTAAYLRGWTESRQETTPEEDDDPGECPALRCAVYGSPAASRWDDCETRDPNRCEPGCTRPSLHDGDCSPAVANEYAPGGWASEPHQEWRPGRHIAEGMTVRIIGADGSTRVGTVGEVTEADGLTSWALIPDGPLRPSPIPDYAARVMADYDDRTIADPPEEPDPLDESDHRPRHDADGSHIYRHGERHWHYYGLEDGACNTEVAGDDPVTLAHYNDRSGPLAFCDCPDGAATIEAENGATD